MKPKYLFIAILCIASLSCVYTSQAKKVTYRIKTEKKISKSSGPQGEKIDFTNAHVRADRDSLYKSITFTGYDKQLNATKESFFVVNSGTEMVRGFTVQINYKSEDGEQYHKRIQTLTTSIPPGETRKIDIPSWDTQCSFYYRLSTPPRRSAIPYDIDFTLLAVWI